MTDSGTVFAAGGGSGAVSRTPTPPLTAAQRLGLMAMISLAAGAVTIWNGLTGQAAAPPGFNGGLDPAALARGGLERSALHWITIRAGRMGYEVDFAPMLEGAAALASVRYGVDRFDPDRTLVLPADRHDWPVPPQRFGEHVITVPASSRFVSVSAVYMDGTTAPLLIYPLRGSGR